MKFDPTTATFGDSFVMLATLVLTAAALGAQSLALVPAVGRTSRRGAMAATALAAAAADDDAPVGKACACGSNKAYVSCCRPLHKDAGARVAAGAREVLTARYSAYVEREADFVMDTKASQVMVSPAHSSYSS